MKKAIFKAIILCICISIIIGMMPDNGQQRYVHAATSATSYTNYVKNWDMESGGTADSFTKWSLNYDSAEFEVEQGISHSGNKSLKIKHKKNQPITSSWYQEITGMEVGKKYLVSGWIRTEGVLQKSNNINACLGIDMKNAQGDVISRMYSKGFEGTNGWTQILFDFTVVQGTTSVCICGWLWDVEGTVWFDDLSISPEYVQNSGVETGSGGVPDNYGNWTSNPGVPTFTWDGSVYHRGAKSLKISQSSAAASCWSQVVQGLVVGASYTLSGWVKTDNVSGDQGARFGVDMRNSSDEIIQTINTNNLYGTNDWKYINITFAVPSGTTSVGLVLRLWGATGTVWFDDLSISPEYVQNAGAESGAGGVPDSYNNWTSNPGIPTFTWDSSVYHEGVKSLKISQQSAAASCWSQVVQGLEVGASYTLSGWVKTENVSGDQGAKFGVDMRNSSNEIIQTVNTNNLYGTNEWNYISITFTVPSGTASVGLVLRLWGATGTAWFDDMSILKNYSENGGAETGTQEPDEYNNWTSSPGIPGFLWDSSVYMISGGTYDGNRSLKISQSSTATSCWSQVLQGITAGKTYKLMGWIKTENVSGGQGAKIGLDMRDSSNNIIQSFDTSGEYGTNDWTYMSLRFTAPSGTASSGLVLRLWGATGTAWFDSVTVIEVGDLIQEPSLTGPWWNNWPRFTANFTDPLSIIYSEASVVNVSSGNYDEGRGAYYRQLSYPLSRPLHQLIASENLKDGAWLEGMGDTRSIIGAVHDLGGGSYEMDPQINAPKLISNFWNWDLFGNGINPDANKVIWLGVPSFANREDWCGSYVRPLDMPEPTYPDSSSATGYLDSSNSPAKAKLYDACGGKDINGNLSYSYYGLLEQNKTGGISIQALGQTYQGIGDLLVPKDMASDWWIKYNQKAARNFIDNGVNNFWIDNYVGFNFLGLNPIECAFGNWSEALFRDFLADHPETGVTNPETFNVRDYLIQKFTQWFPSIDPHALTNATTRAKWSDSQWLSDKVWMAYLSFKSETVAQRAHDMYDAIKSEATAAGKDPDDICVGGNDMAMISNAAVDGTQVDICNFELGSSYDGILQFSVIGLPPYGHTGPVYARATNFSKGRHSVCWYYLDGSDEQYRGNTALGEIIGYEALQNNSLILMGEENSRIVGTGDSARNVNRTIKRMTPIFDKRARAGRVGLVYSTSSEMEQLAPGGYANNGQVPHLLEYYGWGEALEDLNVPYKVIPDFKLTLSDLSGISVLILPHVKCISQDIVDNVLKPFHNNGGTILISGTDSGSLKLRSGLFYNNNSSLLYDLTQTGYADFITGTPGKDFYNAHLTPGTTRDNALNTIKQLIQNLYTQGKLKEEVKLSGGFGDLVLTTLNYDSTANRFFVDFVNVNIDKSTDTITPENGGALTLKLPQSLQGENLILKFYDADDEGSYQQLNYTVIDNETISCIIPEFRVYGSLTIDLAS